MAPIAKDLEFASPQTAAPAAPKPQPAAVEIPVTVNGARTVEGTDKREPFSETTQTVLVFANGAVVRLSSSVAPGQLLFVTNEKSKKEVVCQVVKSKNYRSASGYVELEFTEPAPGFWGMRFPSVAAPAASAPKPAAPVAKPSAQAAPVAPVVNEPAPVPAAPKAIAAAPAVPPKNIATVPAQPPANALKVPSLEEFLAQATKNEVPAAKSPEVPKPQAAGPVADGPSKELREQTARLQSQLSSMLFTQEAAAPIEPKASKAEAKNPEPKAAAPSPTPAQPPAPISAGSSSFDFETEAVKIPSWLEPLARNANVTAAESKAAEIQTAETTRKIEAEIAAGAGEEISLVEVPVLEDEQAADAAPLSISHEGHAPNFGGSLAIDSKSDSASAAASGGSGKGLIFGLLAAGLAIAAGGGWYWYSNQPKSVSAGAAAPAVTTAATASAPSVAPAAAQPQPVYPSATLDAQRNGNAVPAPAANSAPLEAVNNKKNSAAKNAVADQPPLEEIKKPTIGEVHLAAPVVNHSGNQDVAEPEPSLGGAVAVDSGGASALASKSKQPVAPTPVGGDVKQARLVSSVPPVYPQLARSQRISGDVVIDALIDANGHVGAMKVISGPALLHTSAMEALRQWKYQPATLNGTPMAMHLTVTVQFKLQ
ncbi:MAG TPA: TonB family protein [Dongiaceae bacterium]|nr:TonB family protein [Dongiaceae bacterium]